MGAAKVLIVIASHAGGESGLCWLSRKTIAAETGLHPVSVSRAVEELELAQILNVERSPKLDRRRANIYRILVPHGSACATDDDGGISSEHATDDVANGSVHATNEGEDDAFQTLIGSVHDSNGSAGARNGSVRATPSVASTQHQQTSRKDLLEKISITARERAPENGALAPTKTTRLSPEEKRAKLAQVRSELSEVAPGLAAIRARILNGPSAPEPEQGVLK